MRAFGLLLLAACSAGSTAAAVDASVDDADSIDAHKQPPPQLDASVPPVSGPDKLSATGMFTDIANKVLSPDLIAYAPRYELWSDGATKARYLLLPANTKIDTTSMDGWVFPVGTKAFKEFRVGGTLVETRMLWKKPEGWFEMGFLWNADGSDALAAPNGVKGALGTTHDVPSQTDCNNCHMNVTDVLIGVSAIQLSNGGTGMLSKLSAQGRLTVQPSGEFEVPGTGVVKDALAYLHANCGHCHNDTSKLNQQTPLHLDVESVDVSVQESGAYTTAINLVMKHVMPPDITLAIVPGNPDRSGLWLRMQHRHDGWEMPPLATNQVDPAGVDLIKTWIAGLP